MTGGRRLTRTHLMALATGVVVLGLMVAVVGWFAGQLSGRSQPAAAMGAVTPPGTAATSASPAPSASPSPKPSPTCGVWGCAQQARFAAAAKLLAGKPGYIDLVVEDRQTGAVFTAGATSHRIWGGSTPKLALAVDLLERARAGQITLDATAWSEIAAMLHVSDDNAADALWDRYSGVTQMSRFQNVYGMTTASFVPGFPQRWGFIKETSTDLAHLVSYILTRLDTTDRAYVLNAMRNVGPIQQWGVWAAGSALRPGVKDGWSVELDNNQHHWITDSTGFVGPGERYIVAIMYQLLPGATIYDGVHTVSDIVATVFGAPVPATVTVPDPSTGY